MAKLKSAGHHWWPEGVSRFWKNANGGVHRLSPDGTDKAIPPKQLGVITNGHHIKLGSEEVESTVWDTSFESEFQSADDNFPSVITWLASLETQRADLCPEDTRFAAHPASDEQIRWLVEGIVSLAVRSPMVREQAVALAEHIYGPLPARQRNGIIGMNMRNLQRETTRSIGTSGKFVVVYSPHREFIFGDGFFHNVQPSGSVFSGTKIFAPFTPRMSVLYVRPSSYLTLPKLMSYVASAEQAELFNHAVQVYSRNMLFYSSEKPCVVDAFTCAGHKIYSNNNNPIDDFIDEIPGVEKRNRQMEVFFESLTKTERS